VLRRRTRTIRLCLITKITGKSTHLTQRKRKSEYAKVKGQPPTEMPGKGSKHLAVCIMSTKRDKSRTKEALCCFQRNTSDEYTLVKVALVSYSNKAAPKFAIRISGFRGRKCIAPQQHNMNNEANEEEHAKLTVTQTKGVTIMKQVERLTTTKHIQSETKKPPTICEAIMKEVMQLAMSNSGSEKTPLPNKKNMKEFQRLMMRKRIQSEAKTPPMNFETIKQGIRLMMNKRTQNVPVDMNEKNMSMDMKAANMTMDTRAVSEKKNATRLLARFREQWMEQGCNFRVTPRMIYLPTNQERFYSTGAVNTAADLGFGCCAVSLNDIRETIYDGEKDMMNFDFEFDLLVVSIIEVTGECDDFMKDFAVILKILFLNQTLASLR
jgi:hypothetical protein